jgi:predicted HNH restriction endonuclease
MEIRKKKSHKGPKTKGPKTTHHGYYQKRLMLMRVPFSPLMTDHQLHSLHDLALHHLWRVRTFPKELPISDYNRIRDQLQEISSKNSPPDALSKLSRLYEDYKKGYLDKKKTSNLKISKPHKKLNEEKEVKRPEKQGQKQNKKPIEKDPISNDSKDKNDSKTINEIFKIVKSDLENLYSDKDFTESRKVSRHVNHYERNPKLRAAAILLHGTKCMACNFDFDEIYGERGKGFIEVHHINPVSTLENETQINPKDDLIVLCSNCHRIVHRKKDKVLKQYHNICFLK